MITAEPYAGAYSRWGFEQIEARAAPVKVRRNHLMGRLARIISFVMRRPLRRLVILERLPRTVRRERPIPRVVFAWENLSGLQNYRVPPGKPPRGANPCRME